MLINTLVCCGPEDGWILAEDGKEGKRRIVRLEDVRREYQAELDRRSEVSLGRFAFLAGGAAEAMDVL